MSSPASSPIAAAGRKAMSRLRHHREHRAGLDCDVEHVAAGWIEIEQRAGEDEVAGARNRQELGQALDEAENERVQQRALVHAARILVRVPPPPPPPLP